MHISLTVGALLAFAAATGIKDSAIAIEPVPGVDVIVKKNPGGTTLQVQTGTEGRFTTELAEGAYEVTMSWKQISEIVTKIKKTAPSSKAGPASGPKISFTYVVKSPRDVATGQLAEVRHTYGPVTITDRWAGVKIDMSKGGGTLSGTLMLVE